MSKEIPLTQGAITIVDDDDYHWIVNMGPWALSTHGYAVRNGDVNIYMHRAIVRPYKEFEIDHINRDRLDNRRRNLRVVRHSHNCKNMKHRKGRRFKGIRLQKSRKRWEARITVNYKNMIIGYFTTEEDAARAYDGAAIKYYGEYACLNFPKPIIEVVYKGENEDLEEVL